MYSQYKVLCQKKCSQSQMQKFFAEADIGELCSMVLKALNTSEIIKMLDDILRCFSELSRCQDKRQKLIKSIFEALQKAKITTKHADNIVNRIIVDFSFFEKHHLLKLVDYFVERIRNNDDDFMSWKDVIPVLLEKLEEEKSLNYRGSDVSGQEYKIIIIRSICDIDWNTNILTSLAKMFVELIIDIKDKAICTLIMKALTNKLMSIQVNELPPLINQMLKLGSEQNSTLLFSTLSKYFVQKNASFSEETSSEEIDDLKLTSNTNIKELQEVESTVLYYIYQSVLNNAKGIMDYMKCLKSVVNAPEYILDPFIMSVLLLLSGLYEDQALQILKLALLRQIQDEENRINSAWLRKVLPINSSALDVINLVIDNSNKDRQLVLKGMVDFAFVLLSIDRKAGNENHISWDYGCKIIQKIGRKRYDAGGSILEILVHKIVRSGLNVTQYTDCLSYMCRRLTMMVLEHQVWITMLMEHLLVIPCNAAAEVLRAILPLMRISGSIRDNLIMILRKALYRRGTETRQMAVLGFLQLLKNLKLSTLSALSQSDSLSSSVVGSSSSFFTQATLEKSSQRTSSNPWHNTSLCREILAILNKCFSHEADVRVHLYQELYHSILKNQELAEYIIEMLLEHFFKYFEKSEDILPPIIFDKCSCMQGVNIVLQEPVADLIFALQKIYLKIASNDSPRIDKLATVLESLCKRMVLTDLEHLGFDETTDLLDNTPKSQIKLLNVKLTISVYESLIAYRIASWSVDSVHIGQNVVALFKGYSRFTEYIKKINKSKKGGGKNKKDKDQNDTTIKKVGRTSNIKLPNTIMDFDTISKSIILLFNPSNSWSKPDQTSVIRGRFEFHQYVLSACLQLLQNLKSLKNYELRNHLELNKYNFFNIGETLYKFVISDLASVRSFNGQIAALGLECFKECCDVMCVLYSSELPAFLEQICGVQSKRGLVQQLYGLISEIKDIFISSLDAEETDDVSAQKIPLHLIEIILKLVQKIVFNELKVEKSFDWLTKLMEERENIDIQVTSTILQLVLLIEDRSLEYGENLQDLCTEFFLILGRNDKVQVHSTRRFQILNETNIYIAYIAVNKVLSTKLQNINSVLGRLNAEYIALTNLQVTNESNTNKVKESEQNLYQQFSFLLDLFETLSSAKIMPGQASDVIFKNLQKVYNFACALAKYIRKKSTPTNPGFQSVKFIPVIKGAGNALKQGVTQLILHIESSQSGGKSSDANVQRNKILKEVMVIPGVVQAIDMFDKEIALLTKKTGIDLMRYTKYDAIRDFRIQNTQLMENLEKMNVITQTGQNINESENNDENSNDEDNDNADNDHDDSNRNNVEESDEEESESDENPEKKRRTNS